MKVPPRLLHLRLLNRDLTGLELLLELPPVSRLNECRLRDVLFLVEVHLQRVNLLEFLSLLIVFRKVDDLLLYCERPDIVLGQNTWLF